MTLFEDKRDNLTARARQQSDLRAAARADSAFERKAQACPLCHESEAYQVVCGFPWSIVSRLPPHANFSFVIRSSGTQAPPALSWRSRFSRTRSTRWPGKSFASPLFSPCELLTDLLTRKTSSFQLPQQCFIAPRVHTGACTALDEEVGGRTCSAVFTKQLTCSHRTLTGPSSHLWLSGFCRDGVV
jgi:hypothetical protein